MKTNLKQTFILLIAGVIVLGGIVLAGSLTPTTSTPEATYVSLNDVYDKLTTGATTTEKSFTPTVGTDTATMHTLSEIFDVIPEWLTLDNSTTTVPAGYYEATDLAVEDEDLIADNILDTATIFGITGTASAGGGGGVELHTGQVTSYRTGDDSSNDGTAKSMTWSEPVSGQGVVTDAYTGLIWQDGDDPAGYVIWDDAIDYCNGLDWGGYAVGSWRLPNYLEYASVVDFEQGSWNMWPTAFTVRTADYFWTSSTPSSGPSVAYGADMTDGCMDLLYDKGVSNYLARCVRGG